MIGSCQIFEDHWITKEENSLLQDVCHPLPMCCFLSIPHPQYYSPMIQVIFRWLLNDPEVNLNKIDAKNPEVCVFFFASVGARSHIHGREVYCVSRAANPSSLIIEWG